MICKSHKYIESKNILGVGDYALKNRLGTPFGNSNQILIKLAKMNLGKEGITVIENSFKEI